jgi:hypothetical protein
MRLLAAILRPSRSKLRYRGETPMNTLDHPLFVFLPPLALQSPAVRIGAIFLRQRPRLETPRLRRTPML